MHISSAIASVCILLGAAGAHAASLHPESGAVHVNSGGGFAPAAGVVSVPAGSKIMISTGGTALLVYSQACSVKLPSGVWSVARRAPCATGTTLVDYTTRMNHQADVGDGWETTTTNVQTQSDADAGGLGTTTLVVGGLVLGGAAAAALVLTSDGDDKQSSP